MIKFAVFNSATGQIDRVGSCPSSMLHGQAFEPTNDVIQIPNDIDIEAHYIADSIVVLRPLSSVSIDKTTVSADGVDKVLLSNIPVDSVVTLAGDISNSIVATLSSLDLVFDVSGEYKLTVELFPYLHFEAVINAT